MNYLCDQFILCEEITFGVIYVLLCEENTFDMIYVVAACIKAYVYFLYKSFYFILFFYEIIY